MLKIEWETTSYPENPDEKVELCYYPHGSLRQETCNWISPNTRGETYAFNEQKFETYSYAVIKHHINGGKQPARSAAQDKVIFHYSY